MDEILAVLQGTPLPTILVAGGIGLIVLAIGGGFTGKIEVPPERQIWAGIPPSATPTDISITPSPSELLETAKAWPLVLQDTFENSNTGWWTGSYEDEFEISSREIADGKYTWRMEIIQDDVFHWYTPPIDPISDFYLTVTVKQIGVVGDNGMYGLVLRREGDNFYSFEIKDNQTFKFRLRYNGEWEELIDWTSSSSIRPDEANRLTVIADGSHFWLYINDNYVGGRSDERRSIGNVGLKVALLSAGDESIFEFDNFELRRRP
jgi:hypothetical protein